MIESNTASRSHQLDPLFARAEREGLWFWSHYQGLWFSPAALRAEQASGHFQWWNPENWRLRNPQELVDEAQQDVDAAQRRLEHAKSRVYRGGRG